MCSVCYKSTHMNKQETPKPTAAVPAPSPEPSVAPPPPAPAPSPAAASTSHAEGARADAAASPAAAAAGDVPGDEGGAAQPAKQANKNRCYSCNKRVGFTGFECRCGFVYCATHRHANKHACSFDFKAMGRDAVAKANPAVIAEKVDKVRHACLVVLFARTRERTIGFVSQTTHRSRTRRGFSRSRQTYATDVWCPFFFFLNADLTKSVSLRRGRRRRGRTRSRNHL